MVPQLVTSPQIPFRPYECRQREREREGGRVWRGESKAWRQRESRGGRGQRRGREGTREGRRKRTDWEWCTAREENNRKLRKELSPELKRRGEVKRGEM